MFRRHSTAVEDERNDARRGTDVGQDRLVDVVVVVAGNGGGDRNQSPERFRQVDSDGFRIGGLLLSQHQNFLDQSITWTVAILQPRHKQTVGIVVVVVIVVRFGNDSVVVVNADAVVVVAETEGLNSFIVVGRLSR